MQKFPPTTDFTLCGKDTFERCCQSKLTATRLCAEMPRAGGRIFEAGDEKLLKVAHDTNSAFHVPETG